ncbi:hypothetical protein L7F22_059760 [Adiantum nelumboides]|nr:hypothetical protein [Adiantum nelumboides]
MTVTHGVKSRGLYMIHVSSVSKNVINVTEQPNVYLWHRRLGHMSKKGMEILSRFGYFSSFSFQDFEFCEHCLRDKPQATLARDGTRVEGRYIYDENHRQARYPPVKRTTNEMILAIDEAKRCCTQTEKEEFWKKASLSGKSTLWRLCDLFGFDLSLDLVFDVMHTLSLNVFKKYIATLFQNASMKRKLDAVVLIVSKAAPPSIRYGCWPNSSSVYYESFKAEENQKFMDNIFDEMHLLVDIAHSFYSYSQDNGMSCGDMQAIRTLLQSWRVWKEEWHGANSSPLEHVTGSGDLLDDILSHGLHDLYWCYMVERLVKAYSAIKTNSLNDEASFVQFHLRRENIDKLKAIKVHGVEYLWKECDIYTWCIKALASKQKWSKKMSSKEKSMETNAGQEGDDQEDKENEMTKEEKNDFEEEHVENVLDEEKRQKDPLQAMQDIEVYALEISWDDDGNHMDPYETYQSFIKEVAYASSFRDKSFVLNGQDDGHKALVIDMVINDKHESVSECLKSIDLNARKNSRKRKATSKLVELQQAKTKSKW